MRVLATFGLLVLATTGPVLAAGPVPVPSDDIIASRQAGFDLMQGNVEAMKAAIDAGQPVKPYLAGAKAIAAWAKIIPSSFPTGTETGNETKAKPEIWSDPAGFAKAATALQQAADKLAALADADDKVGFATQFEAVGKSCGACHRAYRVRRG